MKQPIYIPMAAMCGSCGFVMQQGSKIMPFPRPNVQVSCTSTNCEQKDVVIAIALPQADIVG